MSYATRPRDGVGIILWLHGGEDRRVIDALLDHALSRLAGRPIEAYPFATALGLGMIGCCRTNAHAADRRR